MSTVKLITTKENRKLRTVSSEFCNLTFDRSGICEVDEKFARSLVESDDSLSFVNAEDSERCVDFFVNQEASNDDLLVEKNILEQKYLALKSELLKKENENLELKKLLASKDGLLTKKDEDKAASDREKDKELEALNELSVSELKEILVISGFEKNKVANLNKEQLIQKILESKK